MITECKTDNHTLKSINKQAHCVAFISGAARRVGAVIATHLHQQGYDVVLHYHHSKEDAMLLCQRLNDLRANSALILHANLMHSEALPGVIQQAFQWKQRLDVLVNNASLFIRTPITQSPNEQDKANTDMWLVNVLAPFKLSQAAFPLLKLTQGCIVNITDIHAEKPLRDYGLYCQTKAALKMQTESFAKEYAPFVRVNAVAPGAIMWPEGLNVLSLKQQQAILAKTPLQCHGDPHWIAEAVFSLIRNQFITGQNLRVSGGR